MPSKEPLGYHVMMGLADRRVIAPTPRARRAVARTVIEMARGRGGLLAFGVADTHLHLLLVLCRALVGGLTRRIAISIQRRLHRGVCPFDRPYPKPVRDQRHLANAFEYILGQNERHRLSWDPLHESSNLPDLLGLRLAGAFTAQHVREALPRVDRALLLGCLGLPSLEPLDPADEPLELLGAAAISAGGLIDRPLDRRARRAAVAVAGRRRTDAALAKMLGASRRTIIRDRQQGADPRLTRAIRLQLAARRQLADLAQGPFVAPTAAGGADR